jgi:hypothetical protein
MKEIRKDMKEKIRIVGIDKARTERESTKIKIMKKI